MDSFTLSKDALINYCTFCQHTYNPSNVTLPNHWKMLGESDSFFGTKELDGYFGVLYVNHETKEIFCAHRGTAPSFNPFSFAFRSFMHNVTDDYILGLTSSLPGGIAKAGDFAAYGREQAKLLGYTFCQGGHSYGGYLGSLDAFLHNEHCYTFDAPSIFPHQQIHFINTPLENYAKQVHVLSPENLINSCNGTHYGSVIQLDMPEIERAYREELLAPSDLIDGKHIFMPTCRYILSTHTLDNIAEHLSAPNSQLNITFSKPDENLPEYAPIIIANPGRDRTATNIPPEQQSLPRSLERLMPLTPAAYADGNPFPMLSKQIFDNNDESTPPFQSTSFRTSTEEKPHNHQNTTNKKPDEGSFLPSTFYLLPDNSTSHYKPRNQSTSNLKITLEILGGSSGGIMAKITVSADLGWPGLVVAGTIFGVTYLVVSLTDRAAHNAKSAQGNFEKIVGFAKEVDHEFRQIIQEYNEILEITDPEEQKARLQSLQGRVKALEKFIFNSDPKNLGKRPDTARRSSQGKNNKSSRGVSHPAPKEFAQPYLDYYEHDIGPSLCELNENIDMNLLDIDELKTKLQEDSYIGNLKNDALIRYKNLCLSHAYNAYQENNINTAIEYCSHGLEFLPDDIDLKISRGDYYLMLDNPEKALNDYLDANKLDPDNFYPFAKIIACYEKMSQWPEMINIIASAKEIFHADEDKMVDLLIKESFALEQQEDFLASIAAIDEALNYPSEHKDALNAQKAVLYLKQNEKITKQYIAYCEQHGDHLEVLIRISSGKVKEALPGFIEQSKSLIQSTLDAIEQCDNLPIIEPTEQNEIPDEPTTQEQKPETAQPNNEPDIEEIPNEDIDRNDNTGNKNPTPKEILSNQLKQAMEQFCGYLVQAKLTDLRNTKLKWDTGQLGVSILSDVLNHYFPKSESLPFFESFAAHGIRVVSHYYEGSLQYLEASYKQFADQLSQGLLDPTVPPTDINSVTPEQIENFKPKIPTLQKTMHNITYVYLGARLLEATVGMLAYSTEKVSHKLPETWQNSRPVNMPVRALQNMHRLDQDYVAPTLNVYAIVSAVLSIVLNPTPLAFLSFPFELIVFVPGTKRYLFGDNQEEQSWHTNRLSLFAGHFMMSMNADLPTIISKYSAAHGNTVLQWIGRLLVKTNVSDSKIKSFLNISAKAIVASRGLLLLLAFLYATKHIKADLMVRHFHNEMLGLADKKPEELAESSTVFGMVKDVFQQNKSFQTAENWSLYVLALFYEYMLANKFTFKPMPHDEEMFYRAISVYTKNSIADLHEKVTEQVELDRIQRENNISDEANDNEMIEIKYGFEMELNALEKALSRPIIVLIHGEAPLFPKQIQIGEPIFLAYNPTFKHFDTLLVREPYAYPAYQHYAAQQRNACNRATDQAIEGIKSTLPISLKHEIKKAEKREHESFITAIKQLGLFAAEKDLNKRIKELESETNYAFKPTSYTTF